MLCFLQHVLSADVSAIAFKTLADHEQSIYSSYNFGSLNGSHSAPLSHIFVLHNSTTLSQTIISLRPTCGCASTLLGVNNTLPFLLLPGRQVSVRVTLDPTNLPPGPVSKTVWVYFKGQDTPAATLEMTGTLLPAVKLSPIALDFGPVRAGGSITRSLAVTWDIALLPKGSQCRLISTNLEVQITPEPSSIGAGTASSQAYRCTLSPQADLGELSGKIEAVVTPPGAKSVVVGAVPIRGDISGDVVASPAVVAFGSVTVGQAASQQIILTLSHPGKLVVTSVSSYLTVQQRSLPGDTPNATQVLLSIALTGKAPVGSLATELTVTTENGQHLKVPVFALVGVAEGTP